MDRGLYRLFEPRNWSPDDSSGVCDSARADVPVAAPALAAGEPYSLEHGSVEQELVARASHTHALFREDNLDVYYKLEEAMRGTPYPASIKPFQRAKQGREAWLEITGQYAGKDKWAAEIK